MKPLRTALVVTLTFTVLLLSLASARAGAWTAGAGKLYDRVAFNFYRAEHNFDQDGDRVPFGNNGRFTDYNLSNYLEFGLTDRLTAINGLAYKRIESEDYLQDRVTWGLGDIDLGARYKLLENRIGVFSAQGLVKIPAAYDRNEQLPLGSGQYDVEGRLLFGRSLWPLLPGYANLEVGYRWRAEDPSDELRYLVEIGGDFTAKLYGRAKLDGLYSLDNGTRRDASGNPTTTNNFDLAKLDLTVGYKLTPTWGLEAAWTPAVYGQNTAAGATWTAALTYQR